MLRLGFDGAEVRQGQKGAYYKPSVGLTSGFVTPQDMFSQLCRKAALSESSWQEGTCDLFRTSWIHVTDSGGSSKLRMKGLRVENVPDLTPKSMIDWAKRGADYLKRNQHSDGGFCYLYNPLLNTAVRAQADAVRAAGCAYAVAEAASSPHLAGDGDLAECARRAMLAIYKRSRDLASGGRYVPDGEDNSETPLGKLGATALLAAGMLCPGFYHQYRTQADALVLALKHAQREKDGLFECVFGLQESTHTSINFFPGEALVALARKASLGDESCREHYRRAFSPYRLHFRNSPSTAFVGWHADVWSRAAVLDRNCEYADFVFEQLDWLLDLQVREDDLTFGGFVPPGEHEPSASSIVFTEAIARGASLAREVGDRRWPRYRDSFLSGLIFCSRLRIVVEQSPFLPDPARSMGGVTRSLTNFRVRSDMVQHLITLALAALDRPELF